MKSLYRHAGDTMQTACAGTRQQAVVRSGTTALEEGACQFKAASNAGLVSRGFTTSRLRSTAPFMPD